jgi:enoyl-CoA hydratase/carnithine racemase
VRIGKRMFYRQQAMDLEEAYRFAGLTMARNMASADARAGIGAFLDKGR